MGFFKQLDLVELEQKIESIHMKYREEGLNCSERTYLTVHNILDTDVSSETVALMSGFGGGIGGIRSGPCGAVTGGIAALGLIYGRRKPPKGSKERVYEAARDFFCRFKGKFGSTICGELIGDLLRENRYDSEERKERCFQYTLNAIRLCVDTLSKV